MLEPTKVMFFNRGNRSLAWAAMRWRTIRRVWPLVAGYAGGLAMIAAYFVITQRLYGQGHLWASSKETLHFFNPAKLIILLEFFTGAVLVTLLSWFFSGSRQAIISALGAFLLTLVFSSSLFKLSVPQSLLISVFSVTTLSTMVSFARRWKDWSFPTDYFLFLWAFGFTCMMIIVMQWVAIRYFIIGAVPMVFLVVRLVEMVRPERANRILGAVACFVFTVSLALCFADYNQAEASRFVAQRLGKAEPTGPRKFFVPEAFTVAYLSQMGWKPLPGPEGLAPGDLVVTSDVSFPAGWLLRKGLPLEYRTSFERSARFPLRVMDSRGGAGFYASAWGPLPFCFSSGPWERFHVFEVVSPRESRDPL